MIASGPASAFVLQLLERNIVTCSLPMRAGLSHRTPVIAEGPLVQDLYCGLMQTSKPAEWKPESDPIVGRSERRNGMAPCRPTRASSLGQAVMKSNHHFDSYFKADSQVVWVHCHVPNHLFS